MQGVGGGNRPFGLRATMKRGRAHLDVLLLVVSEVVGVWLYVPAGFRRDPGLHRAGSACIAEALVTGRNKPDNASDNFNQKLSSTNWTRKMIILMQPR